MKIIFDNEEFILPLVIGQNPKFNFDQFITKQYKYEQLEKTYMEIILYSLPNTEDIYNIANTKNELIEKADYYSSFKISLLTIVIGPEFHNLVLASPSKKGSYKGRVMYIITCKQIAVINVKVNNVKISFDNLNNNDIPKMGESNPLNLNIKTSMYDLALSDSSLNFYTVRTINEGEEVNLKDSIFQKNNKPDLTLINKPSEKTAKIVNHYTIIGFSILSFLEILSENDEANFSVI